jgi:hypothetical protein
MELFSNLNALKNLAHLHDLHNIQNNTISTTLTMPISGLEGLSWRGLSLILRILSSLALQILFLYRLEVL